MTLLRDYYNGNMPCETCCHKNVCNVKECFEETKFETTHPFVDIQVKCTEYNQVYKVVKVRGSEYE